MSATKITVKNKYLTIPSNPLTASKKLMLFCEGALVYDLDCNIDMLNPASPPTSTSSALWARSWR